MLTIGITTFERRFDLATSLIDNIRKNIDSEIPIILTVNGEFEDGLNEEYRKNILRFCSEQNYIYPVVHTTFRSLAKAWNTIIINSNTDHVLILNDDVKIDNDRVINKIKSVVKGSNAGLFTLNHSFSHFVISKQEAINLNFFDERFLTIGEEDGDMVWKYIALHSESVPNVDVSGIYNTAEGYHIPVKHTESHVYNKPKFNRNMMLLKYNPTEKTVYPQGMFDSRMKMVLGEYTQYPYEFFYLKNKHKIKTGENIEL